MSTGYTAHLADDAKPLTTACGEPWQGWQEPEDHSMIRDVITLPPHEPPRPQRDVIRQCQACRRVAFNEGSRP